MPTPRQAGWPGRTGAASPAERAAPLRKAAPNARHPHRAAGRASERPRAGAPTPWRPGRRSKAPGDPGDALRRAGAAAAGQDGPRHEQRARQAHRRPGTGRNARRAASPPSAPHAAPVRGAAAGPRAPMPGSWAAPAGRARPAVRTHRPWDSGGAAQRPPGVGRAGAAPAVAGHGMRTAQSPGAAQPAEAAGLHSVSEVSEVSAGWQPPGLAAAAVSTGSPAALPHGPRPGPSLSAEPRPWGGCGISAAPRAWAGVLARASARAGARASARSAAPAQPSPAAAVAPADQGRRPGTPHARPAKCRRRRPATSRQKPGCSAAFRHLRRPPVAFSAKPRHTHENHETTLLIFSGGRPAGLEQTALRITRSGSRGGIAQCCVDSRLGSGPDAERIGTFLNFNIRRLICGASPSTPKCVSASKSRCTSPTADQRLVKRARPP